MARTYDRFLRQRLSRRRLLAGAGGTALGAAALAACGGGGGTTVTSETPAAEETPEEVITKDGIVHLSFSTILPTIDLFSGPTALFPNLAWGTSVFDHLFWTPLDTQKPEPMLAYEWETVDEEGLETLFRLQEAYFHDKPPVNGRQVLPSDVKASYESYAADIAAAGTDWHRDIMERITAIDDDLTVSIKQNRPYAWLFHSGGAGALGSSNISPIEATPLGTAGFDRSKDFIGSGRFMLAENRSFNFFRGERFPNWRIKGEPWLAGSTSTYIGEPAQAEATFRAGDLDTLGLSNKLVADEMEAFNDRINIVTSISGNYYSLMLNLDRVEEFRDVRVRKAINRAINRKELIQGVELDVDGGVPAGPIPPRLAGFLPPDEEMDEYFRHDPEEARALLEQADFPFDKQLTLVYPILGDEGDRALLLQAQFKAVGLDVKIVDQELATVWYPTTLPNGAFDMTNYPQLSYDDPHFPMSFYTTHSPLGDPNDPRGMNNMAFFDDEITAAVDDAEATLDSELLVEKVKNVTRMIMEKQAPMINLYSTRSYTARWNWYKGHWPPGRGTYAGFNGRTWIDRNMRGS
jgi:peptide/nickel transport system substrate-binding protein